MKTKIKALIVELEKELNPHMEDVIQSYYGSDDNDFSDYASGNFDDDVELGVRIGSYQALEEIIAKLKELVK